jgi:hypothetical protein
VSPNRWLSESLWWISAALAGLWLILFARGELVEGLIDEIAPIGIAIVEFGLAPRNPVGQPNHCRLVEVGDFPSLRDSRQVVAQFLGQIQYDFYRGHRGQILIARC